MEVAVLYGTQKLAVEVSGCSYRLEHEQIPFSPAERQYLLSDERQVYDDDLATPIAEGTTLCSHLIDLSNQINETARALRSERRNVGVSPAPNSLESLYAELEGDAYIPVDGGRGTELEILNGWLDLLQDLEHMEDVIKMYPEISNFERRESWCDRIRDLSDSINEMHGFAVPGVGGADSIY